MTLKHDYAREKLTLLLRDLDRYDGDEFWRQMSRIAHGATDHPSAEELLKERDAGLEREAALEAHVERLDNELQGKALTDDGVLADAYWDCADKITPWLGEKTGPDTLINSVCGSLAFLIEQWREKQTVERERDAALEREASLAAHLEQWDYAIVDAKRCAAVVAFPSNYKASDYQAFAKEVVANIETLSKQTPSTSLALRDAATIHALSFPTMLRKMWSGGEVQQWIEEQASDKRREAEGGQ